MMQQLEHFRATDSLKQFNIAFFIGLHAIENVVIEQLTRSWPIHHLQSEAFTDH